MGRMQEVNVDGVFGGWVCASGECEQCMYVCNAFVFSKQASSKNLCVCMWSVIIGEFVKQAYLRRKIYPPDRPLDRQRWRELGQPLRSCRFSRRDGESNQIERQNLVVPRNSKCCS